MKIMIFGCISALLLGLFFVSRASACNMCEIGESVATDRTAYKEDIAQIVEL
jgi:hypothetical protein